MSRRVTYFNSSFASFDPDALEFITNWEANTSAVMQETQRLAVIDWYRGMKGEGTPNGSNLLTIAKTNGARIFILIPIDDITSNASAYELDAVSNGVIKGSYNNFTSGDFTALGVVGGPTKSFDSGVASNSYSADNFGYAFYSRTNSRANTHADAGSGSDGFVQTRTASNTFNGRVNNSVDIGLISNMDSRGLFQLQRGLFVGDKVKNGVVLVSDIRPGSTNTKIYTFHNYLTLYSPRQLCFYAVWLAIYVHE